MGVMTMQGITVTLIDGQVREFRAKEGFDPEIHGPRLIFGQGHVTVVENRLGRRTSYPMRAILEIVEGEL